MRLFFSLFLFSIGCGGFSKSVVTYDTSSSQQVVEAEDGDEETGDTDESDDSPPEPEDTAEEEEPDPVYEYDLEVTPNPIAFGPVGIGSTSTQMVTLKNVGTEALHLNAISVSDSSIFERRVLPEPPLTMSPNQEISVQVDFSPVDGDDAAAELTIITAEMLHETGNSTSIPLRGRGDSGECEICAPIIELSDDSLRMNALLACETTETVTVTNIGDRPLRINSLNIINDVFFSCGTFSTPPLGAPVVLNEMESHTIIVTFRATRECFEYLTLTSEENTLHILSNDPSEPDAVVQLEGLATCFL